MQGKPVSRPAGRTWGFWGTFLPPFLWLGCFYLVPLGVLLSYAFLRHEYVAILPEFTWDNFRQIAQGVGYRHTLLRTVGVASLVTLIDLILAFPAAYFLAFQAGRFKGLLSLLILLPLWSSYLVRVFAWRIILGTNGILNSLLVILGVLEQPSPWFLYNLFSMTVTLCYVWLPFMVLPLVTALERLPRCLLEAAADLGAAPWQGFRQVTLPLVLPGLLAGCLSVFSLTLGDYITPTLIGGSGDILVGNLVASQFGVAANWPLGSAFAVLMLGLLFTLMAFLARRGVLENL